MNPVVIDISHWQPDPIDFFKLKANGTIGVIHKATESTGYVDPKLFSRAKAAMAAGLCWSTYHFLRPGSMQAQMEHYIGTIDPRFGERLCLDHEDPDVSLDDLVECVQIIRKKRPDIQITVYSGHVIKEQLGNSRNETLARNTSLWIAHYTTPSELTWPKATWPQWSLWQHTDEGTAAGINGNVDADKWNGSDEALVKWFGPADVAPPEPEPAKVIAINCAAGTVFTINGDRVVAR